MWGNETVRGYCCHCGQVILIDEGYVKRGTSFGSRYYCEECYDKLKKDPDRCPPRSFKEDKFA
jgi:predicted SprT family Zn-dependent metalloprotease